MPIRLCPEIAEKNPRKNLFTKIGYLSILATSRLAGKRDFVHFWESREFPGIINLAVDGQSGESKGFDIMFPWFLYKNRVRLGF